MKITTFQIELVPDKEIPLFKRLSFKTVDVSPADVFRRGVHPHSLMVKNKGTLVPFMVKIQGYFSKNGKN